MNYTKNHHLPQWEESDRILMTDFNQMCSDMESGLDKIQDEAAAGRQSIQEIVNKIQKDLGTQGKTVRLLTGSYVGTGKQGPNAIQSVKTGFTPVMMFTIVSPGSDYNVSSRRAICTMIRGLDLAIGVGCSHEHKIHVTWEKDSISWHCPDTQIENPSIMGLWQNNSKGETYKYVILGYEE